MDPPSNLPSSLTEDEYKKGVRDKKIPGVIAKPEQRKYEADTEKASEKDEAFKKMEARALAAEAALKKTKTRRRKAVRFSESETESDNESDLTEDESERE